GETALSLARTKHVMCFIPSLGALIALRERRLSLPSGFGWRPKHLFDFAVWFDRELPAEARALSRVVQDGEGIANAHGLAYEAASAEGATGTRLLEGFAIADVARIACHGRVLPHAEAVDLLVAANGHLPPADLTEIIDADPHILSWQKLAALPKAPVIVFSSACDSGLTVVNTGGERLGLERPLFVAGS